MSFLVRQHTVFWFLADPFHIHPSFPAVPFVPRKYSFNVWDDRAHYLFLRQWRSFVGFSNQTNYDLRPLWWWCDDQKNSCTVRLGFGFNSTVYRIVLQKMRLNWFEQKLMKTSTRSISKLFNEFVQFNQKSFALVLKGRLLIPFDISMRYKIF